MKYIWIIASILLVVIAASLWFAFQRPDFVAAFAGAALVAAWKAVAPNLKGIETQEEMARRVREGRERR